MVYGLVALATTWPAWSRAHRQPARRRFCRAPTRAPKLKLMGVDVASIGDAQGRTPNRRSFTLRDEVKQVPTRRSW